jgi:hypothetical protein
VRISRIPPTIYTRAGADLIGHSEPVLQPSTVVTDLWRTSQISGLRPGFAHSDAIHLDS